MDACDFKRSERIQRDISEMSNTWMGKSMINGGVREEPCQPREIAQSETEAAPSIKAEMRLSVQDKAELG